MNLRPAASGALTETERRVAELAAAGLTNREAAQQLFLAVKTVEANLARVYRKLGISVPGGAGCPDGTDRLLTCGSRAGPSGNTEGSRCLSRKTAGTRRSHRRPAWAARAATRGALTAVELEQHRLVPGHQDAAQEANVSSVGRSQRGCRLLHRGLGHAWPVPLHDEPAHGATVEPPAARGQIRRPSRGLSPIP